MTAGVIGIGEVLWDLLPAGPRLGGAPCNVLVHLARLGHRAAYITAVGEDELGVAARRELETRGLDTSFVGTSQLPTGRAEVIVDPEGVPRFRIVPSCAYEAVDLSVADLAAIGAAQPRALVYGTLAQRSSTVARSTQRLAAALPNALRLYDLNLRPGFWDPPLVTELASTASVIKVNEEEAQTIAGLFRAPWPDLERFCRFLAVKFGLRGMSVTAGGAGASLLLDDVFAQAPAPSVVVADTIGAGDAFAAGLVDGILAGAPIGVILRRSISLGALVASYAGAMPAWQAAELAALEALEVDGSGAEVTLGDVIGGPIASGEAPA